MGERDYFAVARQAEVNNVLNSLEIIKRLGSSAATEALRSELNQIKERVAELQSTLLGYSPSGPPFFKDGDFGPGEPISYAGDSLC